MNALRSLYVVIQLRDQITDKLKNVNRAVDSVKSGVKSLTETIEQYKWAVVGAGAALSAFAYGGFRFFKDATKDLADFQDALRVFRIRAGENADAILKAMEEAAGGTIDSTQLILNANRAMVMGIDPEYLPRMMEIARAAARNMGMSVEYMFESVVLGTARQSKLILDNLGIIIKADEAYEKYAKTLGKTASQLTEAEKRQAFLNAVMEAGEDIVKHTDLSQESLNEEIQRATVAWTEFKKALAEGALPVISKFIDGVKATTQWLKDLPKPIKAVIGTLGVLATGASAFIGPLLMQAAAFTWLYSTIANMGGLTGVLASLKTAILGFASSTLAAIAPLLPAILAISAAILLLQHAFIHNWGGIREATAKVIEGLKWAFGGLIDIIKTFISGFIEPLRYLLGPILEALGIFNKEAGKSKFLVEVVDAIAGAFKWLYSVIEPHIPLIKQIIKFVGILAAGFLLLTNPIGQVILAISAISYVLKAVIPYVQQFKSIWDSTIGAIIAKISEFISAIQNAWKAITENPIFNALQTLFQFTPMGMGLKATTTMITEHRLPAMPQPAQMISTVQNRVEHKTINVPKIEIKIEGVKDPDKVAELVEKRLQRQFNAIGVY